MRYELNVSDGETKQRLIIVECANENVDPRLLQIAGLIIDGGFHLGDDTPTTFTEILGVAQSYVDVTSST